MMYSKGQIFAHTEFCGVLISDITEKIKTGGGTMPTTQSAFQYQLCVVSTPTIGSGIAKGSHRRHVRQGHCTEGSLGIEIEVIH